MGWSVGYDSNWGRDIGYGVPAICDFPECGAEIDRGLYYICGGEPFGGSEGCGLYFCDGHLWYVEEFESQVCPACAKGLNAYDPTPDTDEWIQHKMTDPSWAPWRAEQGL